MNRCSELWLSFVVKSTWCFVLPSKITFTQHVCVCACVCVCMTVSTLLTLCAVHPTGWFHSQIVINTCFDVFFNVSWKRHFMETLSALLARCEGNPPVANGFSVQKASNDGASNVSLEKGKPDQTSGKKNRSDIVWWWSWSQDCVKHWINTKFD